MRSGDSREARNSVNTVCGVVTAYNQEHCIRDAVNSAASELRAGALDEVIVIDDGSTDGTLHVIQSLVGEHKLRNVSIVSIPNSGVAAARNLAMRKASTRWVAFLDGDDAWLPGKTRAQLRVLENSPYADTIVLVYGDFLRQSDGASKRVQTNDLPPGQRRRLRELFVRGGPIVPSTALVRIDALSEVGGFDASLEALEDADAWLRLIRVGMFKRAGDAILSSKTQHLGSRGERSRSDASHFKEVTDRATSRDPFLRRYEKKRWARYLRRSMSLSGEAASSDLANLRVVLAATGRGEIGPGTGVLLSALVAYRSLRARAGRAFEGLK